MPRQPTTATNGGGSSSQSRAPAELKPHPEADLVPPMSERDYAALRASIEQRGLQTPIEIDPSGTVLDGHQRLRAALELGLAEVPVRLVEPEDQVEYLVEAAIRRRQLSASQLAALAVELDDYWESLAAGRSRQRANLAQSTERATLPPRGRTRDRAAEHVGIAPRTVQDATTVKAADAELFAQVKAGLLPANRAARQVRRARQQRELGQAPPPPEGPFQLICADPPWQLGSPDSEKAPDNHYPTMPLEEIKALTVPAAEDAILFLWAVACLLPQALDVLAAWGFDYKTHQVWVKDRWGLGARVRHRHEDLLIATRGCFSPPDPSVRPDSVIEAPRRRHSQKPDLAYEMIERAYPHCSKLELFARAKRSGWVCWGNEVGE
jgi:N6-adenosine-specific RNA methylase IME4/ParB-like chromosome segregation protein Spo0J